MSIACISLVWVVSFVRSAVPGLGVQTEDRYLGRDKMHYQNSVWRAFARMWMLLRFPDGRRRSAELGGSNLYFLRYPNLKRAKNQFNLFLRTLKANLLLFHVYQ